jgi:hypothetical protein
VEFTHELSALKKQLRMLEGGQLSAVLSGGSGANDEIAGRVVEGHGEEDHAVAVVHELFACIAPSSNGP